jgi:hypothetical protein
MLLKKYDEACQILLGDNTFDHDFKFSTNASLVIDEAIVMELQKLIEMAW